MGYNIDLEKITIDQYKKILKTTHLIPSWKILLENVDNNLQDIKKQGIQNLKDLYTKLKRKDQLQEFSKQCGVPVSYLTVLRRMVNGYYRKPNNIRDIPETSQTIVSKLEKLGIKHTLHLFERIKNVENRSQLSEETGIEEKEIMRLAKLTDLSRIRWVNHTFAHALYEAGYDTLKKITEADPKELHEKLRELNTRRKLYPAHIGLNDIERLVESAKIVPQDIQYRN